MSPRPVLSLTARSLRSATQARRRLPRSAARAYATAAPDAPAARASKPPPPPEASASTSSTSPKINAIVDQIGGLTLLEAAELVDALKSRLNIADIAMAAPAPAASAAGPAGGPAEATAEAAAAAAPKEKTSFKVTLTKMDAAQKAKVIKEVKLVMPSMNLVEAKKFVESLPKVLKDNATQEEADKLKKALTAVGAQVDVE